MNESNYYRGLVVCGMTPSTARRYIDVRQKLDRIIKKNHDAAYWLSQFEKIQPDGLCKTLTLIGRTIMYDMSMIHNYLENEFVSRQRIRTEADELTTQ